MSSEIIGKHSFNDVPDVNGTLVLLNAGNTPSILSDILSNRPSAGIAGRLFIDTAANVIYRDTGSVWAAITVTGGISIIDKSVITVSSTANAETSFITSTIPGGTLGTTNLLRIRASGVFNNAAGVNRTWTLRVKYGGTTLYADVSPNQATATNAGWNLDLILASNNSVTAQTLNGMVHIGGTGAVTTGLTGDLGSDEITSVSVITGSSAVNSAVNQTLDITWQPSGTGTTISQYYYFIEKI